VVSAPVLAKLRIPAGITIGVIFLIETAIDIYNELKTNDISASGVVLYVYAIVNLVIGLFYFICAFRVFDVATTLHASKSRRIKKVTIKIICQGVSMVLTFIFAMLSEASNINLKIAFNYLIWVSFGAQSILQVIVFGVPPKRKGTTTSKNSSKDHTSKNIDESVQASISEPLSNSPTHMTE